MHTENSIIIQAGLQQIFETAAAIERWPTILPHYRRVRILQRKDGISVVEMAASRSGFPVKWLALQELHPEAGKIIYRHIKGITKGMYVEWKLTEEIQGVHVALTHDLRLPVPLIGELIANWIIGRVFVSHIADLTLLHIKKLVESRAEV